MGIYNKFLDFIGIEEADDKQHDDDLFEEDDDVQNVWHNWDQE